VKVTAVIQAAAFRFFVPSGPYGYYPEAIQKLKARYNFVGAPTTIEEIVPANPNQGNLFRLGKFQYEGRQITVNELQLYHLGAAASTTSSTDDSDLFLDDLLKWAETEFNITFSEHGDRTYASQLEFQLDHSLREYFPKLAPVGLAVPQYLTNFWLSKPEYQVSSITFSFDPAAQLPTLGNFRIERREKVAYSANLYFSEAPVKTQHHLDLLKAFETTYR
jgi:hypothetical protein